MSEINIVYLLRLAWRRLIFLIIAMVFFASVAFGYCKLIATPQYKATASVLVTNGGILISTEDSEVVNNTDVTASFNLVKTVVDILKTPDIYKQLSAKIDNKYSADYLKAKATISHRASDTLFIDVVFTTTSPEEAVIFANYFAELAPEYIMEYIPYSYAKVVETAERGALVSPVTVLITLGAGVLGMVLMYLILLAVELSDNAIKGAENFTEHYDIPLLGTIPDFENALEGQYNSNGGAYNGY